jgi:hypothetical protein
MTAKDKAKELYNKFEDSISTLEGSDWWESAKKCALTAVDEILDISYWEYMESGGGEEKTYWQEVKQEIINL